MYQWYLSIILRTYITFCYSSIIDCDIYLFPCVSKDMHLAVICFSLRIVCVRQASIITRTSRIASMWFNIDSWFYIEWKTEYSKPRDERYTSPWKWGFLYSILYLIFLVIIEEPKCSKCVGIIDLFYRLHVIFGMKLERLVSLSHLCQYMYRRLQVFEGSTDTAFVVIICNFNHYQP